MNRTTPSSRLPIPLLRVCFLFRIPSGAASSPQGYRPWAYRPEGRPRWPLRAGGRIPNSTFKFPPSAFTAAISASLTVGELSGKIHGFKDLYHARVGTVADSKPFNFLLLRGIATRTFKNEQDGLQAVVDGKIDAFVYDEIVLKYHSKADFPGRIQVLPEIFDPYYLSFAMPQGSELRETLNRALMRVLDSNDYLRLKERYIGPGS